MLAGDSRSAWDSHVLDDPRVTAFWDGRRVVGRWFADHGGGDLEAPGSIVWDAYYAFPKDAAWDGRPTPLLAAGSEIIDSVAGLEDHFLPLLGRS
jgi:hypothetical protein